MLTACQSTHCMWHGTAGSLVILHHFSPLHQLPPRYVPARPIFQTTATSTNTICSCKVYRPDGGCGVGNERGTFHYGLCVCVCGHRCNATIAISGTTLCASASSTSTTWSMKSSIAAAADRRSRSFHCRQA